MGNIEKEIKILNIDVFKILNKLEELGIKTKGKYIQDIYTYDLPKVEVLYTKYINLLIEEYYLNYHKRTNKYQYL